MFPVETLHLPCGNQDPPNRTGKEFSFSGLSQAETEMWNSYPYHYSFIYAYIQGSFP